MADFYATKKKLEDESQQGLEQKIKNNNAVYDKSNEQIKNNYTYQIEETQDDYDDLYRENAVDKKVNEFYIKEEMANMGHSDSGLSRSQITANQISHSNRKNKIDLQRQSMVDGLTQEMTSMIATNEINRLQTEQGIRDSHEQQINSMAIDLYNTDTAAETDRYKSDNTLAGVKYEVDSDERIAKYESDKKLEGVKYTAEQERIAKETVAEIEAIVNKYGIDVEAATKIAISEKEIKSDETIALIEANVATYEADKKLEGEKYKADQSYNASVYKANIQNEQKSSYVISAGGGLLSKNYTGTLAENGVDVYKNSDGKWVYVDNNSGKKTVFEPGQSPHTGGYNKDVFDENGYYDESKVFAANGYQPNNINGVKLQVAVYKSGTNKGKTVLYPVRGVNQKVWKANGNFYIWNKDTNSYQKIDKSLCTDFC